MTRFNTCIRAESQNVKLYTKITFYRHLKKIIKSVWKIISILKKFQPRKQKKGNKTEKAILLYEFQMFHYKRTFVIFLYQHLFNHL